MEERQNEILEVALDRLEQEGMWFTTKDDKIYANAKDLYKLDKYGELEDKSKERLVNEVEQYFGDGAAFVIDAVEQWLQDNLVEGILGYVDTLAMNFEIPEVIETIEAHDIQGVDDLDTTIAEEADLPEGVEREKKEESKKVEEAKGLYDHTYKVTDIEELKEIALNAIYVANNDAEIIKEFNDRNEDKLDDGIALYDYVANNYSNMGVETLREIALNAVYVANDDDKVRAEIEDRKLDEAKSYEDYEEEIYYLEDIINDWEMKGRGNVKDYNRAVKRLNSIKAKFDNDDDYYTESKVVEGYSYYWEDDILEVEGGEANDDIWYAVAENIQQNDPDYSDWDVYDIMSDIISIWKIEKRSRLYDYLLKWYGSEENLLANVRDVLDTDNAIYFVTGCGYSIWSADLLGGKADGVAKRDFEQFIANGCKKEEARKITEADGDVGVALDALEVSTFDELREEIERLYAEEIIDDDQYDNFCDIAEDRESKCATYIEERSEVTNTDEADIIGIEEDYVIGAIKAMVETLVVEECKVEEAKVEETKVEESETLVEGKKVDIKTLREELEQALKEYMLSPEAGFDEEDKGPDKYGFNAYWKEYCGIDVKTDDDGDYLIYVNAELSFDSILNLAEKLDKVVSKYDKDAYFDNEVPGRLVCLMSKKTVKNMTEGTKLEEDNNRDFEAFSKYIMDNVYCDSETLMTTPEIIEDNAGIIAEDAAKQVVNEILGETEYTGLYSSMVNDYEEEIKRIILNNIDRIVYLQNVEQEEVMALINEGKVQNLTEALNLLEKNKVEEVRTHRTLQKGDVYENEKGAKVQVIDVTEDKETVTLKFLSNGEAVCIPMENANNMLDLNKYKKIDECDSVNFNECTKDKLEEGVRQRLEERNEQSADIVEKALQSITDQTNEKESGIITKTSELFQQLSDRGYDVQVSFDNGESTSSIAIGQQGANILITITDPEQPLRAFASGNFELNDDSVKMIKNILDVL